MMKKRYALLFVLLCSTFWRADAQDPPVIVQPPLHVRGSSEVGPVGLIPSQVRNAYGFDQVPNRGAGQTIAIVNAFDHRRIEADLSVFSNRFKLPACTTSNGCFQKIYASGVNPGLPSDKSIWALETALDVEWAHAMAPDARIMLVEAQSDQLSDMLQAVDVAVQFGASVISMSWGTPEFARETSLDNHFVATNVAFVASSGDSGTGILYPAASPNVTAVGGTTLSVDASGNYLGETAWNGSGGGLSEFESEPAFQIHFKIPNNRNRRRGVPDVAYDADPNTGVAIYTTVSVLPFVGWFEVGGTSIGAPQWAAVLAIVDSMRSAAQPPKYPLTGSNAALYGAATSSYEANYHDITSGSNGTCGVLCSATSGYDYVTGLGSPQANDLINALASAP